MDYLIKKAEHFRPGTSWERIAGFIESGEASGGGGERGVRSEKQGVLDIQILIA
jgi:hypothetical protein